MTEYTDELNARLFSVLTNRRVALGQDILGGRVLRPRVWHYRNLRGYWVPVPDLHHTLPFNNYVRPRMRKKGWRYCVEEWEEAVYISWRSVAGGMTRLSRIVEIQSERETACILAAEALGSVPVSARSG